MTTATAALDCIAIAQAAKLREGPIRGAEHSFHCPRHDDRHPSLFINANKNCWMCAPCKHSGGAWKLAAFLAGVDVDNKEAVGAWLREYGLGRNGNSAKGPQPPTSGQRKIAATYPYVDEAGNLLFEVVRLYPKDFRQRRPDGRGGWLWNLDGTRRVLYRLPEILSAENVFIVEGEKDADSLRALGLVATCNVGGAGKWRVEYSHSFTATQRVTIFADNDGPGQKHAQQIAAALAGKVASVKVPALPNLPSKGDISDWITAGGTREQLEEIVDSTPEFVADDRGTMRFTSMRDFLNEPEEQTQWLVADHLPAGGDSLLVAKPKVGKSTLARCLALAVARGDDFLGCSTSQGIVFYLALEEKRSEVRAHFRAMGARDDDPIFIFCATSPEDGLAQLREAIKLQKPALVIVDPLFRFVRVKDGNDYAAVTNALEPLHALARESGAHVQAVHHEGKRGGDGGDSVLGSTALFAAVDTLLTMKRRERYRTLSSIQRYGTDLEEITLEYDANTRTLHAGMVRSAADEAEAVKAILDFLETQTEPVEEKTIHEGVEGKKAVMVKALRQAVKDNKVERTGNGRKNDTYRYSKIVCSLVPTYSREQTKQTPENNVSGSLDRPNACSHNLHVSEHAFEGREQAFSEQKSDETREEFEV